MEQRPGTTGDPDDEFAAFVRDQQRSLPARALGLSLPTKPAATDEAMIAAALALPPDRLDAYFLRRQRSLHAWDIAAFGDYAAIAANPQLKSYVAATLAPLRAHSQLVDRVVTARAAAPRATSNVRQ